MEPNPQHVLWAGLALGGAFGAVAQVSRFCLLRGLRQWRGLDEDYTRKMLAAVVGFRMEVLAWECKLKVNQHRTESYDTQHAVYSAQAQQGDRNAQELLQWMETLAAR